ncbi:MAG: hypothetical protein GF320_09170, partial [Armatimonadia bacterium]|nr:hypothetical protein [Armatimonadia bacterium]
GSIASVVGEREITGEWVELTGVLTGACELALYVDGEEVARGQSRYFIPVDPNEGMQIGRDVGTKVGDYTTDNGFVGLIAEVRVYDGERSPRRGQGSDG